MAKKVVEKSVIVTAAIIDDLRYHRCKLTYVLMHSGSPESVQYQRVTASASFPRPPPQPGTCIARIEYDPRHPERSVRILNVIHCDFASLKEALKLQTLGTANDKP